MKHLTKKGILLFAAVMVSAALVAPAMASAATWKIGGVSVTSAQPATGTGDLTLGPVLGNTITCHLHMTGTVSPLGADSISALAFSGCSSSVGAACTVNASATSGTLPWASQLGTTSPLRDTISGISFTNVFGASCGLFSGQTLQATGSLSPAVTNTGSGVTATFNSTSGSLSTTFGSAGVVGTIALSSSAGLLSAS